MLLQVVWLQASSCFFIFFLFFFVFHKSVFGIPLRSSLQFVLCSLKSITRFFDFFFFLPRDRLIFCALSPLDFLRIISETLSRLGQIHTLPDVSF